MLKVIQLVPIGPFGGFKNVHDMHVSKFKLNIAKCTVFNLSVIALLVFKWK